MEFVLWIGAAMGLAGWGSLALRIYLARRNRQARNVTLGAHCAMTVIGVVLMMSAYYIHAAR